MEACWAGAGEELAEKLDGFIAWEAFFSVSMMDFLRIWHWGFAFQL